MRLDLLPCGTDDGGKGSLALIKAACLAGSAHHNLRMDYAAVCGSRYRRVAAKPEVPAAAAAAAERAADYDQTCYYTETHGGPSRGDFFFPSLPPTPKPLVSPCKPRRIHLKGKGGGLNVIECGELLTSSRRRSINVHCAVKPAYTSCPRWLAVPGPMARCSTPLMDRLGLERRRKNKKRPLFGSTVSRYVFFLPFFFQKRVRRSLKLCFNHFANVLSSPITCKAIVLLANSSSGAFIKTPPPCLMLMNPRTRSFLMILRKCSPLLSPSYRHLPCSPFFFCSIYLIHPLVFKGPINEMCPQQFSPPPARLPRPSCFAYLLSAVVICRLPPPASEWMSRAPRGRR